MAEKILISSESVTEGHPDKVADQISDGVLDAILAEDPMGRVACETLVTTGLIQVAGEITTSTYVDIPRIAREIVKEIGYTRAKYGFDGETCAVLTAIDEQSSDIALGVDKALELKEGDMSDEQIDRIGAGDQGMMIGYATDETEEFLPMPFALAQRLSRRLTKIRKEGILDYVRPDGKTQVTLEYVDGVAVRVDTVVVSTQHGPDVSLREIREDITEQVIDPILPKDLIKGDLRILVNPTGRFVMGGPMADSGLTGRKIIVDTYGGMVPHGGGAFSGKDPTKVDRSGAYMARYAAKNVVAAGLASRCQIQVAYAIGVARPVSIFVETFGTGKVSDDLLTALVRKNFDFRPAAMIRDLELRKPQYRRIAAYGHMGRIDLNPMPAWERLDRVEALKSGSGV
ncbi:methionine adenosyltransferase [Dethiosulfovibrio salsuginis]|uniref:S-adenosylmethionine synthase n=1 Tax=Dethiosulfovibrio salsuginis TaxID=561720 RepID=A0A1X7KQB8_9BACT|nr:methionine adenosyltransferase [Dethiosulfovibrio salsuginis]SMG42984.1 methionine adenosyltransferase [Dethiosulfovibrio salsuginis]